jgi:uncharacterized membrane protein YdjX (TVP38/TMEM64 family)
MRRFLRPVLLVLFIAGVVWAYGGLDLGRYMTREGMQALVDSAGPYGPLVFMAVCIAGIFMHLPEIVLIAIGGMVFGGLEAFAYGWVACLIGTTCTFFIVRYFARDHFQRALAGRFARLRALDERLARNGFWTVLGLRLVLFLAPPLNWVLGATRVRPQHYVAGTALGIIPGMATTVFFADSIANRPPGSAVLSPRVALGALLVMAVVATASVASRRLLGREQAAPRA